MAQEIDEMIAQIDLMKDAVYIVRFGELTKLNPMDYGTDEIIWNKSNVMEVTRTHRVRLNNSKNISLNKDETHIDV